MKIVVLLADAGQSDVGSGKTHVLGLGWSVIGAPTTQPMAVVVLVTFDEASEASGAHEIVIRLVDGDGSPVVLPDDEQSIVFTAALEVDSSSAAKSDAPVVASVVLNVGPGLPIEPDRQYRWIAEINEQSGEARFATRPA